MSFERIAPAAAAYKVVEMILPASHFVKNPMPFEGIRVKIIGGDNIETEWDFDMDTWLPLRYALDQHPGRGIRWFIVKQGLLIRKPKDAP
jgi:hypothetical protein